MECKGHLPLNSYSISNSCPVFIVNRITLKVVSTRSDNAMRNVQDPAGCCFNIFYLLLDSNTGKILKECRILPSLEVFKTRPETFKYLKNQRNAKSSQVK